MTPRQALATLGRQSCATCAWSAQIGTLSSYFDCDHPIVRHAARAAAAATAAGALEPAARHEIAGRACRSWLIRAELCEPPAP